jgi:acyl carrier protein
MENLETELKHLIIDTFELEGMGIEEIDSDAPLFVEGLGLDSIDALELGLALKKKYSIYIDADSPDVIRHFSSVRSLALFVAGQPREKPDEQP